MGEYPLIPKNTSIPPELSGLSPRRTRPTPDTRFALILLAVFTGITAAGCLWFWSGAVQQIRKRAVLRQSGAEAVGEIKMLGRVGRGGDSVQYTFSVNNEIISGKAEVPSRLMGSLSKSEGLTIRYLPFKSSHQITPRPGNGLFPRSGLPS